MNIDIYDLFDAIGLDISDLKSNAEYSLPLKKDSLGNFYLSNPYNHALRFILKFKDFNPKLLLNFNVNFTAEIVNNHETFNELFSEINEGLNFEDYSFICYLVVESTHLSINDKNKIYPEILLNESLVNLSSIIIPEEEIVSNFKITKPELKLLPFPIPPKKTKLIKSQILKWNGNKLKIIVLFLVNLFLFVINYSENTNPIGLGLLIIAFIWLVSLVTSGFYKYIQYDEIKLTDEEYQKLSSDYEGKKLMILNKNSELENNYKIEIESFKNKINLFRPLVRKNLFKKLTKSQNNYLKKTENLSRGKTELFFLKYLLEKDFKVLIDLSITLNNKSFEPDFTIVCNKTGFHLDIEIDEPYSFTPGKPIHHDRSLDGFRNNAFLENNWGVIRFSELQIIKYPLSCALLISDLLESIQKQTFDLYFYGPIIKKWTYEESMIMMETNFRNTYLPKEMQQEVKRELKKSIIMNNRTFTDDGELPF
ncbi:hypothetical protein [Mongoliitalea daihaiensis]|uniref:hypothetical protein n=1 Tax=Mongoliitalea daihaiensis TaxID=2782006 RepID=UPI001F1AF990|nr:hypothetical protein [Mongoliitalea daihaiensis]UJP63684.1 hypothetical protein IPZ59_12670 [Mongoliitalea daihaiensis]